MWSYIAFEISIPQIFETSSCFYNLHLQFINGLQNFAIFCALLFPMEYPIILAPEKIGNLNINTGTTL